MLSYYYGGLSNQELFDCFNHLLRSGQVSVQYNEWVRSASPALPDAFRQLCGVSVKDKFLCTDEIFPHLRYSKSCIDYFLTHLVFPKQFKEFESKLSASGWDLGMIKTHPTVGFSGTNDTRHLLPLSVRQLDLPSQMHTNAMVIDYLLRDSKTSVERLAPRKSGTDAAHLLAAIVHMQSEVRVLVDCGAAILELNNKQVAETWLGMVNHDQVHVAVFFDDEVLSILDRSGRIEPFQTSPFA
jgi:hypothetical protein